MRNSMKRIRKSTVIFVLAVLLALWIGVQIQGTLTDVKEKHRVQVVTLKENIMLAPYSVIEEENITLKEVDRSSVHPDTVFRVQDVVGKRTSTALLQSTVIREGHLLQSDSITGVLASLGEDNLVAATVSLEPDQTDLVRAGDLVTLYGLVRQGTETALLSIRKIPVVERNEHVITVAILSEQADALNQVLLSGGKIRIVLNQP